VIVQSIENYLTARVGGADPNAVIEALMQVETPEARPMWAEQVKRWSERLGQIKQSGKPEKANP
jgi:hypothetical protein